MHNGPLRETLHAYVEEAAQHLAAETASGAEVGFELISRGRTSSPLYCYRPLTEDFIDERLVTLRRLTTHAPAARTLARMGGLDAYLRAAGQRVPPGPAERAESVLAVLLASVWAETTSFSLEDGRFDHAYAGLEAVLYAERSLSSVVAPVEGLALQSDRVLLGDGLSLDRERALADAPPELEDRGEDAVVVVLRLDADAGRPPPVEAAGQALRRLQTALRLWDDACAALGPAAWVRTDGGPWTPVPLATGSRRHQGVATIEAEAEDPLRAFCSLVARRTPRSGELAWALRRFELGCERPSAREGLTDHLLALRALLEPEGPTSGRLVPRLVALCAPAGDEVELSARAAQAMALERAVVAGVAPDGVEDVIEELGLHLRALLRDVLCGHLDPDLAAAADLLLVADPGRGEDPEHAEEAGAPG